MFEVSKYGAHELTQTVKDDAWAVRNEAGKRCDALAKKMAAAKAKMAKLADEMAQMEAIYAAALAQIQKEQEG